MPKIIENLDPSFITNNPERIGPFCKNLSKDDVDAVWQDLLFDISPGGSKFENLPMSDISVVFVGFINACALTCFEPPSKETQTIDVVTKYPTKEQIFERIYRDHQNVLRGMLFYIDKFLSFDQGIPQQKEHDFRRPIYDAYKQAYLRVKEALAPSGETED